MILMSLKKWLAKVLKSQAKELLSENPNKMKRAYSLDACLASANVSLAECGLTKADIQEFRTHSTVAGSVKQTLGRFMLTPERLGMIWAAVAHVVVWEELILFFLVGFLLPQIIQWRQKNKIKEEEEKNEREGMKGGTPNNANINRYQQSTGYHLANNIAQMAQLAFVIYLVDIAKLVLQGVGFEFPKGELPHAIGNILYMGWILNRVSALKRFILAKQTKCDPNNLKGQVQLVDRVVDAVLYFMTLYIMMDSVKEDMGAPARGFLALGSVGTFVFTLASQGLATQLFNGLFLASSNRMAVGEWVKCSNGVTGSIMKLGWMETIIRGPDEVSL